MNFQYISKTKRISCAGPSTRRSVQFLAALYIHALALVILVVFSRNAFSTAIRSTLLPLLRQDLSSKRVWSECATGFHSAFRKIWAIMRNSLCKIDVGCVLDKRKRRGDSEALQPNRAVSGRGRRSCRWEFFCFDPVVSSRVCVLEPPCEDSEPCLT
jgi:hypothetical protein